MYKGILFSGEKKNIRVAAVAALDSKRGIGKGNKLLFRIKEDFERMRKLIAGKPLIMGRRTYESVLSYTEGKIIPGSKNIVITSDPDYGLKHKEGCIVTHSLEVAMEIAAKDNPEELIIFGGQKVFEQALPVTDRLYLTVVEGDFDADTFFPDYSQFKKVISQEDHVSAEGLKFKFLDLERKTEIW